MWVLNMIMANDMHVRRCHGKHFVYLIKQESEILNRTWRNSALRATSCFDCMWEQ